MYNIIEEVVDFLRKVPPFQFLDEETLKGITKDVSMELYPKGTTILHYGGPMGKYLNVIKKGAVKISLGFANKEDVTIDYRSDGDLIGYLALFGAKKSRANVVAIEDTICYLLRIDAISELIKKNPDIKEFFQDSFLNIFLDKAYNEIYRKTMPYTVGGNIFYTTPVEQLASKKVITGTQDMTIQESANTMSRNKISALVLVDSNGTPVGIVTDRDLRDKVVAKGRNVGEPIKNIMSPPLIRADAKELGFEVFLKMLRHNVHHVLIIDDGALSGIITNHDFMILQGTSPITLVKDIENQQSIEGLMPLSRGVDNIVGLFLNENVKATNIGRVISEINDRILKKVLEIAEQKYGTPPVPYCWIVYGSEGRKEQTFRTDQDNAIIYADPPPDKNQEDINAYFGEFTFFVRDSLQRCGFPLCPADYMASNPKWCQPLSVWKKRFSNWISFPTSQAIMNSVIFLDFRGVYGDLSLADSLRDHIFANIREQRDFFYYLATMAVKNAPPLGFLKKIVVERSGEHKDQLDLKTKGIAPIVDIARLYSIEYRIRETSTYDRVEALKDKVRIMNDHGDELLHAFEFIMLLRMRHQFMQIKEGAPPDNYIYPDKLSNLEKRTIKEAFKIVGVIQDIIILNYNIIL